MKLGLYVYFDKVMGLYSDPFTSYNNDVAKRKFLSEQEKGGFIMNTDIELYQVGVYNTETGVVSSFEKPEFLLRGGKVEE